MSISLLKLRATVARLSSGNCAREVLGLGVKEPAVGVGGVSCETAAALSTYSAAA